MSTVRLTWCTKMHWRGVRSRECCSTQVFSRQASLTLDARIQVSLLHRMMERPILVPFFRHLLEQKCSVENIMFPRNGWLLCPWLGRRGGRRMRMRRTRRRRRRRRREGGRGRRAERAGLTTSLLGQKVDRNAKKHGQIISRSSGSYPAKSDQCGEATAWWTRPEQVMVPITSVIVDNHGPCGMFLLTISVHKISFLIVHKLCDHQARTT